MKLDPYKHKERYIAWKNKIGSVIPDITIQNSQIILQYLNDMERGLNVSILSQKGPRSYIRLNSLREKIIGYAKKFNELYNLETITDISEDQLLNFFADMRDGVIKRKDGKEYQSVDTSARIFKAFWHWHQKVSRKKGIEIKDITLDLDTKAKKPDWVYLTEKEVRVLCDNAKPDYKALIMFLFDTGIRSPTELMNVKLSDLFNDCKEVNIREETSKTFGRRVKLMLCSDAIRDYIERNGLKTDDYLFPITPARVNEYLKRLAKRIFGEKITPAGAKYSEITMYDFRHIACCYWLPRYKSESALKYRFGWRDSEKIHYYSELLGMSDTISEEDMLLDVTKTEIEKSLKKSDQEKEILSDRVRSLEKEISEMKKISLELIRVSTPKNQYLLS
ncbi:MAG: tyrosine-type recombinase/integrase [Nanoarchaeota archaeon]